MDRMNNNFNPFDFDVEAFTRAYYQQGAGQQSEDARQRTSFEEQLGELKLGSSDESSGGNGSLAAFSGECSGGVRRDMGASMRTPPRFASSDSSSNSSRHSVDIPDPVSSPEIQIKKGKKRGMWSRIKSAVGKSSSGSHSEKAFGAPKQQEIVSTNVQVFYVKHRNSRLGAFEEDEALVQVLLSAETDWSDRTIRGTRADARNFSAWLHMNGREPIAGRLGTGVDEAEFDPGLEEDLKAYNKKAKDGGKLIRQSLSKLRWVKNALSPPPPPPPGAPYPTDTKLIRLWDKAEKEKGTPTSTRSERTRRLYGLSGWLRTNNRGAMADRLSTPGLTQDVKEYAREIKVKIKAEPLLRGLQKYKEKLDASMPSPSAEDWNYLREQMQEPASWPPADLGPQPGSSYELAPFPASASDGDWNQYGEYMQEPASWPPADLGPQPGSSYELAPFPASASDGDWNQYGEYMQQPAPYPWSAPSNFYDGVQPPFDMTTPYVMNDYAPGHAGQRDEAGPSHQGVVDLGHLIPGGWEHYERWLPDNLTQALDQHLMPAPGRPTYFNIQGVPYMAALVEKDGRPRVRIYPEFG